MSFLGFQRKSKIRMDPRLGNGLEVHPRWGRRKLWGSPNIFGPNRKKASNTFERAGGTEYFWTKRGSRPRKLVRTRARIPQAGRTSEGRFNGGEIV